jgi:glycosyltransferase involved in cell wall biosynthesis
MAEAGIETHVAFTEGGPNLARMERTGVVLHKLPRRNNHDPRVIIDLLTLMRRLHPSLVQTWLTQMDVFGGVAAKILGLPTILSERSSRGAYSSNWKNRFRLLIGIHADAVVANSHGGLDYWREHGKVNGLHLIRNALSSIRYGSISTNDAPDGEVLMFAGRLCADKNVIVLLEAFIQVVVARPNLKVKLFGEGPLRRKLEHQIAESNMAEKIELAGYSEDLSSWMRKASLCVSVSNFEGHPNVVIEAASVGCPLVLSDIPAHREILDDSSGWFVQKDEAADIAEKIFAALDDPLQTRNKAQQAKGLVQEFNLDYVKMRYLSTYDQILKDYQPKFWRWIF